MFRHASILLAAAALWLPAPAQAADYYVSASRGKGKKATKEKPAKDLGNIISKLAPGDTVHIAGGTYLGRGRSGSSIITVPVNIIGGYSDDFSARDPWGAHRTILSGENKSENWKREPALMIDLMKYREKAMPSITVDGIIVDHGARNRYKTDKQHVIVRSANPKTKQNPTPDQGGLVIRVSKSGNLDAGAAWKITVQNCIVMNTAPTQGALSVAGHKNSKITIRNNVVINNTGTGILLGTKYRGGKNEGMPEFLVENNTVLFTWQFDPSSQSFSGNSIKFDHEILPTVRNNVFAFADKIGVHNAAKSSALLQNNIILGNVVADYLEFDTKIGLADIEDEAEHLHEDSENNAAEKISVRVSGDWAKLYGARVLIDRNAAEADVKVQQTRANEIRSILGLPLIADDLQVPESPAWLNRISVDDAVKAGSEPYNAKGSSTPK